MRGQVCRSPRPGHGALSAGACGPQEYIRVAPARGAMPSHDVIVAGAGPAGSSAARAAALGGASVALLEREAEVAQSVRTSGVTWMDAIREFGIPRECYHPVRTYSMFSPRNEVVVRDSAARAAVLDVRRTYRRLASRAVEAGADLHAGTPAKGPILEGGAVRGVRTARAEFRARVTVDATGFHSAVARGAGLVAPWRRFGVGAEWEAHAEGAEEDEWWLMVGSEYSPAGYAWVFPLGGDMVRIGVGIAKPESGEDPAARLARLLERRPGPLARLGRVETTEYHYGIIPNGGASRKTVHDGLLLAGDTAGQANPIVLEGIRHAIRYGESAGREAARAAASGDASARAMRGYEKSWRREIASRIRAASRVQDRWLDLDDAAWDAELDAIRGLSADEFLDFVRGDFGPGYIARMAAAHPRLAARQLGRLVAGALSGPR